MKSYKQKYEEAAQRNMCGLLRAPQHYRNFTDISDVKRNVGIRRDDTRFDKQLFEALPWLTIV